MNMSKQMHRDMKMTKKMMRRQLRITHGNTPEVISAINELSFLGSIELISPLIAIHPAVKKAQKAGASSLEAFRNKLRDLYPNEIERQKRFPREFLKKYFPADWREIRNQVLAPSSEKHALALLRQQNLEALSKQSQPQNDAAPLVQSSTQPEPTPARPGYVDTLIKNAEAQELANSWQKDADKRKEQDRQDASKREIENEAKELQRRALVMSQIGLVVENIPADLLPKFEGWTFIKMASNPDARNRWGVMKFVEAFMNERQPAAVKVASFEGAKQEVRTAQQRQHQPVTLTAEGSERTVYQRDAAAQASFKRRLVTLWGGKCGIEGIALAGVLEAAHISHGTNYNDDNGILMTPTMHALFDRHLVGIEPATLTVHVSPSLPELAKYDGLVLNPPVKLDRAGLALRWAEYLKRTA
ncbi:TPA: hypothetical protein JG832_002464 [Enterobacter hormaechei subsp. xiangfangensis]|nr:hypothetical protein [Enterobacter hormaechei subsp. xiangfangensis]HAV1890599.1 hypothetical protein [Enterobacter hormaechei subsp. xiangfangensis]